MLLGLGVVYHCESALRCAELAVILVARSKMAPGISPWMAVASVVDCWATLITLRIVRARRSRRTVKSIGGEGMVGMKKREAWQDTNTLRLVTVSHTRVSSRVQTSITKTSTQACVCGHRCSSGVLGTCQPLFLNRWLCE